VGSFSGRAPIGRCGARGAVGLGSLEPHDDGEHAGGGAAKKRSPETGRRRAAAAAHGGDRREHEPEGERRIEKDHEERELTRKLKEVVARRGGAGRRRH
jgi:hypothetical protein